MHFTDQQLIKSLKEGDKKSFEKIYTIFYYRLVNFAEEYFIDVEVAREMVQDSFLRLWKSRSRSSDDTYMSSLLFTITRNNSLNYLKPLIARCKYIEYTRNKQEQYQLNYIVLKDETFNSQQSKFQKVFKYPTEITAILNNPE